MNDRKIDDSNLDLAVIEKALAAKFGESEFAAARERAKFKLELARAVKRRRLEMNMDQKELAKKLHTTQQQLSRYEVGENSPTADRLYDLCKVLGLELVIRDGKEGTVLLRACT